MKLMIKRMAGLRPVARIALAALLLMGVVHSPQAHADTMLLASTNLVTGSSSGTFTFDAPAAGMVTARLASIDWPVPLDALSFTATTATDTLATWSSSSPSEMTPYVDSFQVGAGTYFAHVGATAGGTLDLGLYSLMLTFTPSAIPLPTAASLLLLGLAVFFGLRRTLRPVADSSLAGSLQG